MMGLISAVIGDRAPIFIALTAVVGLLLGLAIGVPIGMNTDAAPQHLGEFYAAVYVQAVADGYAATGDAARAAERMAYFPDYAETISWARQLEQGTQNDLNALARLDALQVTLDVQAAAAGEAPAGSGGSNILLLAGACLVIIAVAVVGGGGVMFLRSRAQSSEAKSGEVEIVLSDSAQISADTPMTDYSTETEPPVAQFMTTYMLGDDLYDDSFSIDDAKGDFLGECGVGIGETIGVGDPKKVQTFEVWLFDKNDIRTVTSVLMSEHAFQDEALMSKLSAKGDPVLAAPGEVLSMETASLQVTARIVDMQYGSAPLPPNSFFQQLTIELAAFKKDEADEAAADEFSV